MRRALGLSERLTRAEIERLATMSHFDGSVTSSTWLVKDFMRRFRSSGHDVATIRRRCRTLRSRAFISFYEQFEFVCAETLACAGYVDFDWMIHEATSLLESGKFRTNWRDLILDEYQDVSEREIRFLEALASAHGAEVFAVGDDWQAIYGFKGSAWDALQTAARRFGGGDDIESYEYPETHRSVDAIVDTAESFVRKNPHQTQKHLRSTRPPSTTPRIFVRGVVDAHGEFPTESLLQDLLEEIFSADGPSKDVLVLARATKHLPPEAADHSPEKMFKAMTIHGAKGLGANTVILTDAYAGFPGMRMQDPLHALVQPPEPVANAEERRVFYVALTRAREDVHILTTWNKSSSFLEELRDDENVVFIDEPDLTDDPARPADCPECGCGVAYLSKYDNYICTNYPFCDFNFPKCSCGGVIADASGVDRCFQCLREYWICWECEEGIIEHRFGRQMARCSTFRSTDPTSCQAAKHLNALTRTERGRVIFIES